MRWLLVIVALASLGSCFASPHLGAGGWVLFVCLYLVARRVEHLEERGTADDDRD